MIFHVEIMNIIIKNLKIRLTWSPLLLRLPSGHKEQRETRSIGGAAQMDWDAHTNTHSLSHSHVICYPICTVTKLPVTPGPSGGYTHSYTVKQLHRHTQRFEICVMCTQTRVRAQQRCSRCVIGGADSCGLSRSLEWAPTLWQPRATSGTLSFSLYRTLYIVNLVNCVVDNVMFHIYCQKS